MTASRVYLRKVRGSDRAEMVALATHGRTLHDPWIAPPNTLHAFRLYLKRTQREDHEGLLVCLRETHEIAGVINLNNIVRGSFLSASLGYYATARLAGQGYMAEGLNLVKAYAFGQLGLHRIEANIQPDNERSIKLVRRCGFEREGASRAFLFIDGAWRDHERWAFVDPRRTLGHGAVTGVPPGRP